jgi:hypothetical protein
VAADEDVHDGRDRGESRSDEEHREQTPHARYFGSGGRSV